jgi:hypothetical protein
MEVSKPHLEGTRIMRWLSAIAAATVVATSTVGTVGVMAQADEFCAELDAAITTVVIPVDECLAFYSMSDWALPEREPIFRSEDGEIEGAAPSEMFGTIGDSFSYLTTSHYAPTTVTLKRVAWDAKPGKDERVPRGKKKLGLVVSFEAGEDGGWYERDFRLYSDEGYEYVDEASALKGKKPLGDGGYIRPNRAVTGWISFEVPKNMTSAEVVYDNAVTWAIQKQ